MQIFTSLALFNILISPLNAFPWVINGMMEAWVSTKRVNAFLQLEEQDLLEYYGQSAQGGDPRHTGTPSTSAAGAVNVPRHSYHYFSPTGSMSGAATPYVISIQGGSFTWAREDKETDPGSAEPGNAGRTVKTDGAVALPSENTAKSGDAGPLPGNTSNEAGTEDEELCSAVSWTLDNVNIAIKPVRATSHLNSQGL